MVVLSSDSSSSSTEEGETNITAVGSTTAASTRTPEIETCFLKDTPSQRVRSSCPHHTTRFQSSSTSESCRAAPRPDGPPALPFPNAAMVQLLQDVDCPPRLFPVAEGSHRLVTPLPAGNHSNATSSSAPPPHTVAHGVPPTNALSGRDAHNGGTRLTRRLSVTPRGVDTGGILGSTPQGSGSMVDLGSDGGGAAMLMPDDRGMSSTHELLQQFPLSVPIDHSSTNPSTYFHHSSDVSPPEKSAHTSARGGEARNSSSSNSVHAATRTKTTVMTPSILQTSPPRRSNMGNPKERYPSLLERTSIDAISFPLVPPDTTTTRIPHPSEGPLISSEEATSTTTTVSSAASPLTMPSLLSGIPHPIEYPISDAVRDVTLQSRPSFPSSPPTQRPSRGGLAPALTHGGLMKVFGRRTPRNQREGVAPAVRVMDAHNEDGSDTLVSTYASPNQQSSSFPHQTLGSSRLVVFGNTVSNLSSNPTSNPSVNVGLTSIPHFSVKISQNGGMGTHFDSPVTSPPSGMAHHKSTGRTGRSTSPSLISTGGGGGGSTTLVSLHSRRSGGLDALYSSPLIEWESAITPLPSTGPGGMQHSAGYNSSESLAGYQLRYADGEEKTMPQYFSYLERASNGVEGLNSIHRTSSLGGVYASLQNSRHGSPIPQAKPSDGGAGHNWPPLPLGNPLFQPIATTLKGLNVPSMDQARVLQTLQTLNSQLFLIESRQSSLELNGKEEVSYVVANGSQKENPQDLNNSFRTLSKPPLAETLSSTQSHYLLHDEEGDGDTGQALLLPSPNVQRIIMERLEDGTLKFHPTGATSRQRDATTSTSGSLAFPGSSTSHSQQSSSSNLHQHGKGKEKSTVERGCSPIDSRVFRLGMLDRMTSPPMDTGEESVPELLGRHFANTKTHRSHHKPTENEGGHRNEVFTEGSFMYRRPPPIQCVATNPHLSHIKLPRSTVGDGTPEEVVALSMGLASSANANLGRKQMHTSEWEEEDAGSGRGCTGASVTGVDHHNGSLCGTPKRNRTELLAVADAMQSANPQQSSDTVAPVPSLLLGDSSHSPSPFSQKPARWNSPGEKDGEPRCTITTTPDTDKEKAESEHSPRQQTARPASSGAAASLSAVCDENGVEERGTSSLCLLHSTPGSLKAFLIPNEELLLEPSGSPDAPCGGLPFSETTGGHRYDSPSKDRVTFTDPDGNSRVIVSDAGRGVGDNWSSSPAEELVKQRPGEGSRAVGGYAFRHSSSPSSDPGRVENVMPAVSSHRQNPIGRDNRTPRTIHPRVVHNMLDSVSLVSNSEVLGGVAYYHKEKNLHASSSPEGYPPNTGQRRSSPCTRGESVGGHRAAAVAGGSGTSFENSPVAAQEAFQFCHSPSLTPPSSTERSPCPLHEGASQNPMSAFPLSEDPMAIGAGSSDGLRKLSQQSSLQKAQITNRLMRHNPGHGLGGRSSFPRLSGARPTPPTGTHSDALGGPVSSENHNNHTNAGVHQHIHAATTPTRSVVPVAPLLNSPVEAESLPEENPAPTSIPPLSLVEGGTVTTMDALDSSPSGEEEPFSAILSSQPSQHVWYISVSSHPPRGSTARSFSGGAFRFLTQKTGEAWSRSQANTQHPSPAPPHSLMLRNYSLDEGSCPAGATSLVNPPSQSTGFLVNNGTLDSNMIVSAQQSRSHLGGVGESVDGMQKSHTMTTSSSTPPLTETFAKQSGRLTRGLASLPGSPTERDGGGMQGDVPSPSNSRSNLMKGGNTNTATELTSTRGSEGNSPHGGRGAGVMDYSGPLDDRKHNLLKRDEDDKENQHPHVSRSAESGNSSESSSGMVEYLRSDPSSLQYRATTSSMDHKQPLPYFSSERPLHRNNSPSKPQRFHQERPTPVEKTTPTTPLPASLAVGLIAVESGNHTPALTTPDAPFAVPELHPLSPLMGSSMVKKVNSQQMAKVRRGSRHRHHHRSTATPEESRPHVPHQTPIPAITSLTPPSAANAKMKSPSVAKEKGKEVERQGRVSAWVDEVNTALADKALSLFDPMGTRPAEEDHLEVDGQPSDIFTSGSTNRASPESCGAGRRLLPSASTKTAEGTPLLVPLASAISDNFVVRCLTDTGVLTTCSPNVISNTPPPPPPGAPDFTAWFTGAAHVATDGVETTASRATPESEVSPIPPLTILAALRPKENNRHGVARRDTASPVAPLTPGVTSDYELKTPAAAPHDGLPLDEDQHKTAEEDHDTSPMSWNGLCTSGAETNNTSSLGGASKVVGTLSYTNEAVKHPTTPPITSIIAHLRALGDHLEEGVLGGEPHNGNAPNFNSSSTGSHGASYTIPPRLEQLLRHSVNSALQNGSTSNTNTTTNTGPATLDQLSPLSMHYHISIPSPDSCGEAGEGRGYPEEGFEGSGNPSAPQRDEALSDSRRPPALDQSQPSTTVRAQYYAPTASSQEAGSGTAPTSRAPVSTTSKSATVAGAASRGGRGTFSWAAAGRLQKGQQGANSGAGGGILETSHQPPNSTTPMAMTSFVCVMQDSTSDSIRSRASHDRSFVSRNRTLFGSASTRRPSAIANTAPGLGGVYRSLEHSSLGGGLVEGSYMTSTTTDSSWYASSLKQRPPREAPFLLPPQPPTMEHLSSISSKFAGSPNHHDHIRQAEEADEEIPRVDDTTAEVHGGEPGAAAIGGATSAEHFGSGVGSGPYSSTGSGREESSSPLGSKVISASRRGTTNPHSIFVVGSTSTSTPVEKNSTTVGSLTGASLRNEATLEPTLHLTSATLAAGTENTLSREGAPSLKTREMNPRQLSFHWHEASSEVSPNSFHTPDSNPEVLFHESHKLAKATSTLSNPRTPFTPTTSFETVSPHHQGKNNNGIQNEAGETTLLHQLAALPSESDVVMQHTLIPSATSHSEIPSDRCLPGMMSMRHNTAEEMKGSSVVRNPVKATATVRQRTASMMASSGVEGKTSPPPSSQTCSRESALQVCRDTRKPFEENLLFLQNLTNTSGNRHDPASASSTTVETIASASRTHPNVGGGSTTSSAVAAIRKAREVVVRYQRMANVPRPGGPLIGKESLLANQNSETPRTTTLNTLAIPSPSTLAATAVTKAPPLRKGEEAPVQNVEEKEMRYFVSDEQNTAEDRYSSEECRGISTATPAAQLNRNSEVLDLLNATPAAPSRAVSTEARILEMKRTTSPPHVSHRLKTLWNSQLTGQLPQQQQKVPHQLEFQHPPPQEEQRQGQQQLSSYTFAAPLINSENSGAQDITTPLSTITTETTSTTTTVTTTATTSGNSRSNNQNPHFLSYHYTENNNNNNSNMHPSDKNPLYSQTSDMLPSSSEGTNCPGLTREATQLPHQSVGAAGLYPSPLFSTTTSINGSVPVSVIGGGGSTVPSEVPTSRLECSPGTPPAGSGGSFSIPQQVRVGALISAMTSSTTSRTSSPALRSGQPNPAAPAVPRASGGGVSVSTSTTTVSTTQSTLAPPYKGSRHGTDEPKPTPPLAGEWSHARTGSRETGSIHTAGGEVMPSSAVADGITTVDSSSSHQNQGMGNQQTTGMSRSSPLHPLLPPTAASNMNNDHHHAKGHSSPRQSVSQGPMEAKWGGSSPLNTAGGRTGEVSPTLFRMMNTPVTSTLNTSNDSTVGKGRHGNRWRDLKAIGVYGASGGAGSTLFTRLAAVRPAPPTTTTDSPPSSGRGAGSEVPLLGGVTARRCYPGVSPALTATYAIRCNTSSGIRRTGKASLPVVRAGSYDWRDQTPKDEALDADSSPPPPPAEPPQDRRTASPKTRETDHLELSSPRVAAPAEVSSNRPPLPPPSPRSPSCSPDPSNISGDGLQCFMQPLEANETALRAEQSLGSGEGGRWSSGAEDLEARSHHRQGSSKTSSSSWKDHHHHSSPTSNPRQASEQPLQPSLAGHPLPHAGNSSSLRCRQSARTATSSTGISFLTSSVYMTHGAGSSQALAGSLSGSTLDAMDQIWSITTNCSTCHTSSSSQQAIITGGGRIQALVGGGGAGFDHCVEASAITLQSDALLPVLSGDAEGTRSTAPHNALGAAHTTGAVSRSNIVGGGTARSLNAENTPVPSASATLRNSNNTHRPSVGGDPLSGHASNNAAAPHPHLGAEPPQGGCGVDDLLDGGAGGAIGEVPPGQLRRAGGGGVVFNVQSNTRNSHVLSRNVTTGPSGGVGQPTPSSFLAFFPAWSTGGGVKSGAGHAASTFPLPNTGASPPTPYTTSSASNSGGILLLSSTGGRGVEAAGTTASVEGLGGMGEGVLSHGPSSSTFSMALDGFDPDIAGGGSNPLSQRGSACESPGPGVASLSRNTTFSGTNSTHHHLPAAGNSGTSVPLHLHRWSHSGAAGAMLSHFASSPSGDGCRGNEGSPRSLQSNLPLTTLHVGRSAAVSYTSSTSSPSHATHHHLLTLAPPHGSSSSLHGGETPREPSGVSSTPASPHFSLVSPAGRMDSLSGGALLASVQGRPPSNNSTVNNWSYEGGEVGAFQLPRVLSMTRQEWLGSQSTTEISVPFEMYYKLHGDRAERCAGSHNSPGGGSLQPSTKEEENLGLALFTAKSYAN